MKTRGLIALFSLATVLAAAFSQPLGAAKGPLGATQPKGPQELGLDQSTQVGRQLAEIVNRQRARLNGTQVPPGQERRMNTHGYRVRTYVHGLLNASELINGSLGQQVRGVARRVEESSANMTMQEERIQNRNQLVKFLFGADRSAVRAAEQQMNMTRERLQEMEQLQERIQDPQVQTVVQEQMQQMQQEMEQLRQELQSEKRNRGIFGFLMRQ